MPYALLSSLWISTLLLFLTVATGLHFWSATLKTHVILALTSVTFALFAHTMTMFYFIGTGKKIKEFIENWDTPYKEETRRRIIAMKRKIFPHMTFVCLVLMTAFILGGALDAKVVSRNAHMIAAYAAFIYNVHVTITETLYLFKNIELIEDINHEARRRTDSTQAAAH